MKEILFYIFLLVPFFVVTGLVFYGYSHIFYFLFKYLKPLSIPRRNILQKFHYYKKLSFKQKAVFEKRVQRFISLKEFIPREMDEVTQEMRVLIAASAVQLTFGLPEIQLADFDKIYVYPKKYFSSVNRQYHTGEVNPRGYIAISWEAFEEGYKIPNDGYNLGLHEMAHALSLENRSSDYEENIFDKEAYKNWKKIADQEYMSIKNGEKSYLRKYAFSDRDEFFPVCIEYFFEKADEFKKERPDLYHALSKLLNQNPAKS
jgi:MtfA peptidase